MHVHCYNGIIRFLSHDFYILSCTLLVLWKCQVISIWKKVVGGWIMYNAYELSISGHGSCHCSQQWAIAAKMLRVMPMRIVNSSWLTTVV